MPRLITPRRRAPIFIPFLSTLHLLVLLAGVPGLGAGPLEDYVGRADDHFSWKTMETAEVDGFKVMHLEMTSQRWREHLWKHHMRVVIPPKVRHEDIALVYITGGGSGERELEMLRILAERSGALAAVLTGVPNQPLYDGRKEDALIAYTFEQFSKTGDPTWPVLFPMVKSAVRAMDAIQALAKETRQANVQRFIISGASKRGWTTWLTGAADKRVTAMAPIVIDMLNMKVQLDWAEKCYGKQSEEIKDYTDLSLHLRMDEPAIVALRQAVDPYHYRERYTMPKLILLGTNDPYWTVDALRHYWDDLPEPKLVYQTPNAGHDLGGGKDAIQTLAAFYQMIADRQPLPKMAWTYSDASSRTTTLTLSVDQKAEAARLWTTESKDRDFRDDKWDSRDLTIQPGSSKATASLDAPEEGYRAMLGEVELLSPTGHPYKLSTAVRVTPDTFR